MKFQRSTLILFLSALLLGGFVYVYEIQGAPKREAAKTREQQIFSFPAADVQSVTVITKTQTLMFERNSQTPQPKTEQSKWLMKVVGVRQETQKAAATCAAEPAGKTPTEGSTPATCAVEPAGETPAATASPSATASPAAAQAPETKQPSANKASEIVTSEPIPAQDNYVDYLLSLLTTGKSYRAILMSDPAKQLREFGLEEPRATVEVKLKNQESRRFLLGNPDFNNSAYYAHVQTPGNKTENLEVLLVSTDLENAVERPLSDWKKEEKQQPDKNSGEKPSVDTPKETPADAKESPKNSPESQSPEAPADSQ